MSICALKDQPDVIPTLAQLLFDEWGQELNAGSPETIENFLHNELIYASHSLHQTFVFLMGKQPVGMVKLIPEDTHYMSDKGPWLECLYVIPELRGYGIGRELVGYVENFCRHQHVAKLYLYAPIDMHFYQEMSWKPLRTRRFADREEVVMTRELSH